MTIQYEQNKINYEPIIAQPQYESEYFEEFLLYAVRTRGWRETQVNGSITVGGALTEDSQHPGIVDMVVTPVTPGTSQAGYRQSITQQILGGGPITLEWCINIAQVPDAVDDYAIGNGFRDTNSGNPTDGLIVYGDGSSPNWQLQAFNPALTSVDTLIPIVPGWQIHRLHVNPSASLAYVVIEDSNGTTRSETLASGIPSLSTSSLGIGFSLLYLAGAPTILQSVDYLRFHQKILSGRRLGV